MKIVLILLTLLCYCVNAAETCSRVAIINYQEILIDTSSTQKGEGLRYYLEKDSRALEYLDKYQKGTQTKIVNAALGTLGTLLMLTGLLTNSSDAQKRGFLIGGAGIIAVDFAYAKIAEVQNEGNLIKAIEEYNKRNLPRIYFAPDRKKSGRNPSGGLAFMINLTRSF